MNQFLCGIIVSFLAYYSPLSLMHTTESSRSQMCRCQRHHCPLRNVLLTKLFTFKPIYFMQKLRSGF